MTNHKPFLNQMSAPEGPKKIFYWKKKTIHHTTGLYQKLFTESNNQQAILTTNKLMCMRCQNHDFWKEIHKNW